MSPTRIFSGGKPIARGTRISVEIIREWLATGATPDDIVSKHPQLTVADVRHARQFLDGRKRS